MQELPRRSFPKGRQILFGKKMISYGADIQKWRQSWEVSHK